MKSTHYTFISSCSALLLLLLLLTAATNVSSFPILKRQLPPQCNTEDGYFIPPNPVIGADASKYCQSMGGALADINNQNVATLTGVVNSCIGTDRNVRIQTWDTNAFGTNNLVLYSGYQAGAGTVSTSGANEKLFALCKTLEEDFSGGASLKTANQMIESPSQPSTGGFQEDNRKFTFYNECLVLLINTSYFSFRPIQRSPNT
jgi:hypothetical protein